MTKIEELNKELDELQAKINEVQKKIEEAKQTKWPQDGDTYWFTYSHGDVNFNIWTDDRVDYERKSVGNAFKTRGG